MVQLDSVYGCPFPAFVELVKNCLHNIPQRRPSSKDLLVRLRAMKMEVEGTYGGSMIKQFNIASILYIKEMRDKDQRIQQLKVIRIICWD